MTDSVKYILKAVKKTDRPTAIRFMETLNNSVFRRKKALIYGLFSAKTTLSQCFLIFSLLRNSPSSGRSAAQSSPERLRNPGRPSAFRPSAPTHAL